MLGKVREEAALRISGRDDQNLRKRNERNFGDKSNGRVCDLIWVTVTDLETKCKFLMGNFLRC